MVLCVVDIECPSIPADTTEQLHILRDGCNKKKDSSRALNKLPRSLKHPFYDSRADAESLLMSEHHSEFSAHSLLSQSSSNPRPSVHAGHSSAHQTRSAVPASRRGKIDEEMRPIEKRSSSCEPSIAAKPLDSIIPHRTRAASLDNGSLEEQKSFDDRTPSSSFTSRTPSSSFTSKLATKLQRRKGAEINARLGLWGDVAPWESDSSHDDDEDLLLSSAASSPISLSPFSVDQPENMRHPSPLRCPSPATSLPDKSGATRRRSRRLSTQDMPTVLRERAKTPSPKHWLGTLDAGSSSIKTRLPASSSQSGRCPANWADISHVRNSSQQWLIRPRSTSAFVATSERRHLTPI